MSVAAYVRDKYEEFRCGVLGSPRLDDIGWSDAGEVVIDVVLVPAHALRFYGVAQTALIA